MNLPLLITIIVVAVAVGVGFVSRGRKRTMDLEQWTVAGRNFGGLVLWILAAGEIYTSFTFLGAAGYAYGQGGPAFYIVGYGALAYIISFFLLPPLWRYAKRNRLLTQADYFSHRFSSPWLGVLVAVVGVVFVVPYADEQLEGLGDIIATVTNHAVSQSLAMVVAFGLVALFVLLAGLRSVAWTSVAKDALLIGVVIAIGIYLPVKYFGSYSSVVKVLNHSHPGRLALPGASGDEGVPWFISTLLLTSMGFYMYPQAFLATYSARSAKAIRRNATFLPLYGVLLMMMLFVGFTAVAVMPGLSSANTNYALLDLMHRSGPTWLTGLVGGAGALASMVPTAAIVLAAATLIGRNIYQGILRPAASAASVLTVSRVFVIVIMAVALYFAIANPTAIVNLLLTSYDGVTQFFPAVLASILWRRTSKIGAAAGIAVGVGLVLYLVVSGHDPLWGLNAGAVALVANAIVMILGSLAFPGQPRREVTDAYAPMAAVSEATSESTHG